MFEGISFSYVLYYNISNMGGTKHQHIIPRFYLNGFATEEGKGKFRLWQFDSETQKRLEISTKDACVQKGFYDLSTDKDHKAESLISHIEANQAIELSRILKEIRNHSFDINDINNRVFLLNLIFFMRIRTVHIRSGVRRMMEEVLDKSMDMMIAYDKIPKASKKYVRLIPTEDGVRGIHLATLLEDYNRFHDLALHLSNEYFFVIIHINPDSKYEGKKTFFTTDNPAKLDGLFDSGPYGLGQFNKEAYFSFPLASDVLLLCGSEFCREVFNFNAKYTMLEIDPNIPFWEEYLQKLNFFILRTATRFVYSIDSNFSLPRMLLRDRKL